MSRTEVRPTAYSLKFGDQWSGLNAHQQSNMPTACLTRYPMPHSSAPFPITLLVMTFNEQATIARCLDSVTFASEKIVIDSGSTDRTVAVAEQHGARVVHQEWLGYGAQRVFANRLAAHEWVLFLDADEWLSPELSRAIQTALPQLLSSTLAAASFMRCTLFLGSELRWYRPLAAQPVQRLYHRQRTEWNTARVHEALKIKGEVLALEGKLMEHGVPTLLHRQLKDMQYAELKVRDWLDKGSSKAVWHFPLVFLATFIKDYLLRLAILDGWRGVIIAYMAAHYAVFKRLRYWDAHAHRDTLSQADALLERIKRG